MIRAVLTHLTALVLLAAALWFSSRLPGELDLSAGARHSLSPTTLEVLERLEGKTTITAYVPDKPDIRRRVRDLIAPYASHYPHLALEFIDPKDAADAVRDLGIPASGAVIVTHEGATEMLRRLDETTLTSALQRLMVRGDRWIVAVKGHGERRLDGAANHDLRDFAASLEREGYHLHTVDLPTAGAIPDNTSLLIIADPRTPFLLHEQAAIADYIARGGNLLWLAEPETTGSTRWLEDQVPVNRLPGSIVDAAGARLGLDDPRLVAVGSYASHPVTARLKGMGLFPDAAGLVVRASGDEWTSQSLISSSAASWNETGSVKGEVSRDADRGETRGPLALGLALERAEQRVMVFGDSDFLSNAYLGNGANLDLGLNAVRWLSGDDKLLDIPAPAAADARLDLSPRDVVVLAGVFLILLPMGMLASGLIIHFRRSRR